MKKSVIATLAIILGVALCWAAPPSDKLPSLLTTPAEARNISVIVGGSPPTPSASAYCTAAATCTATTPGECDVLCEDFEGSSYCVGSSGDQDCRATWTVLGAANSVDWTTTHGGTFSCTDKGTNSAQFNFTADTQYGYYKTAAADKALSYVQFYINFTGLTLGADHAAGFFGTVDSTLEYGPYLLTVYNDGGTYRFALLHSDTATNVIGSTTAISIGTNTWYRIRIMYNITAGTATVKVNDTTEINVASGVTGHTPRSFIIGPVGALGSSGESITFQIDNIAVDDDTEQGACN